MQSHASPHGPGDTLTDRRQLLSPTTEMSTETAATDPARVAYFSMEINLEQGIPTYSGGLGVLAGDTLRSAADLRLPVVGITLAHRRGYFRQHPDAHRNQTDSPP